MRQITVRLWILGILCAGLLSVTSLPLLAQEAECSSFPPEIHDGDAFEGEITNRNTAAFYCFEAQQGQTIIVTMTTTSGNLDPYLSITDQEIDEIYAENDDVSQGNLNSRIEFAVEDTNTYLLVATRYNSGSGDEEDETTGEYRLTFDIEGEESSPEPSAPQQSFANVCRNEGSLILAGYNTTAELNEETFSKAYCFYGIAETEYRITLEATSGTLDTLLIVEHNEERLDSNDDASTRTTDSVIEFTAEETGAYVVWAARSGYEDGTTEGEYELSVEDLTNETPQTCPAPFQLISNPLEIEPQIGGDIQSYCFEGEQGDVVGIGAISADDELDMAIVLADPTLKVIKSVEEQGNTVNLRATLPDDGTYILTFYDFVGETDFSVEFEGIEIASAPSQTSDTSEEACSAPPFSFLASGTWSGSLEETFYVMTFSCDGTMLALYQSDVYEGTFSLNDETLIIEFNDETYTLTDAAIQSDRIFADMNRESVTLYNFSASASSEEETPDTTEDPVETVETAPPSPSDCLVKPLSTLTKGTWSFMMERDAVFTFTCSGELTVATDLDIYRTTYTYDAESETLTLNLEDGPRVVEELQATSSIFIFGRVDGESMTLAAVEKSETPNVDGSCLADPKSALIGRAWALTLDGETYTLVFACAGQVAVTTGGQTYNTDYRLTDDTLRLDLEPETVVFQNLNVSLGRISGDVEGEAATLTRVETETTASCASDPDNTLVEKNWISVIERVSYRFTFDCEGVLNVTLNNSSYDSTYRLTGTTLILRLTGSTVILQDVSLSPDRIEGTLRGDTITLIAEAEAQSAPPENTSEDTVVCDDATVRPLVDGSWTTLIDDELYTLTFLCDGDLRVASRHESYTGSYTYDGKTLTLRLSDQTLELEDLEFSGILLYASLGGDLILLRHTPQSTETPETSSPETTPPVIEAETPGSCSGPILSQLVEGSWSALIDDELHVFTFQCSGALNVTAPGESFTGSYLFDGETLSLRLKDQVLWLKELEFSGSLLYARESGELMLLTRRPTADEVPTSNVCTDEPVSLLVDGTWTTLINDELHTLTFLCSDELKVESKGRSYSGSYTLNRGDLVLYMDQTLRLQDLDFRGVLLFASVAGQDDFMLLTHRTSELENQDAAEDAADTSDESSETTEPTLITDCTTGFLKELVSSRWSVPLGGTAYTLTFLCSGELTAETEEGAATGSYTYDGSALMLTIDETTFVVEEVEAFGMMILGAVDGSRITLLKAGEPETVPSDDPQDQSSTSDDPYCGTDPDRILVGTMWELSTDGEILMFSCDGTMVVKTGMTSSYQSTYWLSQESLVLRLEDRALILDDLRALDDLVSGTSVFGRVTLTNVDSAYYNSSSESEPDTSECTTEEARILAESDWRLVYNDQRYTLTFSCSGAMTVQTEGTSYEATYELIDARLTLNLNAESLVIRELNVSPSLIRGTVGVTGITLIRQSR